MEIYDGFETVKQKLIIAGMQEIENAMLLQSINPQDRAIFQLRYFDGYSAEEIAQMMNLPPGTIRSKLSRCRKFLKQNLE